MDIIQDMTPEERIEVLPRRYYSPTGAYELYDADSNTWYDQDGEEIASDESYYDDEYPGILY